MLRAAWYALATPKPAPRGVVRASITLPAESKGRFVTEGSASELKLTVEFRPVTIAVFGALNMSTRSWMLRLPPRRILRAIARSSTLVKQPRR